MTRQFRITRRAAVAGLATLPLLGREASAQTRTEPKKGGTLTFAQGSEPQTLVA